MKKFSYGVLAITMLFTACKTLTSTTYIKPNDAFILGNNVHREFKVRLKNISNSNLEIWRTPLGGGQHSKVLVKPTETIQVKVEENTALRINNNSNEQATVELLVKGDTGLSMGYKK